MCVNSLMAKIFVSKTKDFSSILNLRALMTDSLIGKTSHFECEFEGSNPSLSVSNDG